MFTARVFGAIGDSSSPCYSIGMAKEKFEYTVDGIPSPLGGLSPREPSDEPPVNVIAPSISGIAAVGYTLTVDKGAWTGEWPISYVYQWNRNGVFITGETGTTYVVVLADAGEEITVTVFASNAFGNANVTTAPVYPTALGGDALLKEDGDLLLSESGDRILIES